MRPEVGRFYVDGARILRVDEVVEADPLGRDVRGVVFDDVYELATSSPYATDIATFRKVWRLA